MDAKHCEKSPDCCHPWDDSCSCDCNGCDPVRTCPDCGDRFRSHGGHGASACLHTLRTRLTDAERERDEARALLREAFVLLESLTDPDDRLGAIKVDVPDPDGIHPRSWLVDVAPGLAARIDNHLRNEEW